MKQKQFAVYMMTNKRKGTIYTGVTNNLSARIWQHKNNVTQGFTKKYNLNKLVYYEQCTDINLAIEREKQIKKWPRQCKLDLIEKFNPEWRDLFKDII